MYVCIALFGDFADFLSSSGNEFASARQGLKLVCEILSIAQLSLNAAAPIYRDFCDECKIHPHLAIGACALYGIWTCKRASRASWISIVTLKDNRSRELSQRGITVAATQLVD